MYRFKLLFLLCSSISILNANVYYSKVEPYEVRKISSNVMGVVLETREDLLGKKLSHEIYVEIDSQLDRDELKSINLKLDFLKKTIIINEKIAQNLADSLEKKRLNYAKVKILKIKSSVEKDREFYDLIVSENAHLSKQKEINTLKTQLSDLEFRKSQLVRSLSDKKLSASGFVLYSIDVKVGQVVTKGTLLATLVDTSKAIVTIYLSESDLKSANKAVVYINDKKTDYTLDRILNIADSKNISKYKAQIIVDAPKIFSELAKVELKIVGNEK